jgi:hypothetical protein
VALDEFRERGLREALEDLDRLEALARTDERVLDDALRMGAVVPFRICTVYEGCCRTTLSWVPVKAFARAIVMIEQLAGLGCIAMIVSRLVGLTGRGGRDAR